VGGGFFDHRAFNCFSVFRASSVSSSVKTLAAPIIRALVRCRRYLGAVADGPLALNRVCLNISAFLTPPQPFPVDQYKLLDAESQASRLTKPTKRDILL